MPQHCNVVSEENDFSRYYTEIRQEGVPEERSIDYRDHVLHRLLIITALQDGNRKQEMSLETTILIRSTPQSGI